MKEEKINNKILHAVSETISDNTKNFKKPLAENEESYDELDLIINGAIEDYPEKLESICKKIIETTKKFREEGII